MIRHRELAPSHPELQKQRLICVAFGSLAFAILLFNLYALSLFNIQPTIQYQLKGAENSLNKMLLWPKVVEASRLGSLFDKKTINGEDYDILYLSECWNDKEWLRMVKTLHNKILNKKN